MTAMKRRTDVITPRPDGSLWNESLLLRWLAALDRRARG